MSKDKLDDTFNIAESKFLEEEFEVPEDPEERDLDLIIELALKMYKDILDVIELVEPKNRIKYMEMGERYLNQAKDARFKKERLQLDRQKMKKGSTAKSPAQPAEGDSKEEEGQSEGISRKELQERMRVVK